MESKIFELIEKERSRQAESIELIASENFVSENVKRAVGSCLTNKYAEGYPSFRMSGNQGRYYGGCEFVDEIEEYCCAKWKEAFTTDYHVNVQPHSGSNANIAAYMSVLNNGDTILTMDLQYGGHLTHGSPVNISGKIFNVIHYGVTPEGFLDYEDLREKIDIYRPKLVLAGASAYSRIIDFQRIYTDISAADERPIFMVDMAHIAGLVISGDHQSPFGLADIITTTTHKTLRGPRGGMIFCKPEYAKAVDSAVFPGVQGGPLMHVIAGKAVAAEEACEQNFKDYIHKVVRNSRAMAEEFQNMGYKVVAGGTDNHMFLLDLTETGLTGKQVQEELDKFDITLNKNCIPFETRPPYEASGIRIGTSAMTTKGFTETEFRMTAKMIDRIIRDMQKKM